MNTVEMWGKSSLHLPTHPLFVVKMHFEAGRVDETRAEKLKMHFFIGKKHEKKLKENFKKWDFALTTPKGAINPT